MSEEYGALAPRWLDRAVIATTSRLPDNWLGLRLSIALRRITTKRLTDDSGFDVERFGLRVRLHPRRNGCEKFLLFVPQMYEVTERAALAAQTVKAKAEGRPFVFVDIGANVGLFSLFVASCIGRDGKILAVEPEPENIRRLRFNIEANPGVPIRVIATALGESSGKAILDIDSRDRGGTRTLPWQEQEHPPDRVVVECRSLLQVLREEHVQSIDALKIDVEGAENIILSAFFRDAPRALWPRLVIIESAGDLREVPGCSRLMAHCYTVTTRSKQNVIMCLEPPPEAPSCTASTLRDGPSSESCPKRVAQSLT